MATLENFAPFFRQICKIPPKPVFLCSSDGATEGGRPAADVQQRPGHVARACEPELRPLRPRLHRRDDWRKRVDARRALRASTGFHRALASRRRTERTSTVHIQGLKSSIYVFPRVATFCRSNCGTHEH